MTTEQTTEATQAEDSTETKPDTNAELRAYADRVAGENKELRTELMRERLGAIGLSDDAGLGKAIAKEYDGAMDLESITNYAAHEYGHQVGERPTSQQALDATQRADQLAESDQGGPIVTAPTSDDEVAAAERKLAEPGAGRREATDSIAAKVKSFAENQFGR